MKSIVVLIGWLFSINHATMAQPAAKSKPLNASHILLAIFAHPDDELLTGAVLAHYAAAGAKVYVAIATDGALGTTDFSNIPAGDQLVKVRKEEMICSARALGIQPPIFMGLPDQLNMLKGGLPSQLDTLRERIAFLIDSLQPQVIITFGADGWTGHPDHRLIGIMVTEVFASTLWPGKPALYYTELPTGSVNKHSWAQYRTIDSSYLTVRIPLASTDYKKLQSAFQCHRSQYRESVREKLPRFLEATQKQQAMFRPFVQSGKIKNSLF